MTASNDQKTIARKATAARGSKAHSAHQDVEVGKALRSIYQQTIEEKVPDEMLNLLGKLS